MRPVRGGKPSYDELVSALAAVKAEFKAVRQELAQARVEIAWLRAENAELKRRLAKDSSNSSKPPSSYSPVPQAGAAREATGRKPGAQPGHPGGIWSGWRIRTRPSGTGPGVEGCGEVLDNAHTPTSPKSTPPTRSLSPIPQRSARHHGRGPVSGHTNSPPA
ncbi:DUF6444 domain-containing protein [Streptomyces sp. NPDC086549]|uniref:DUF6444 domain-containing protein n=1 Tax=Streptomyces sp. NPDC086549 TaxID=3365752 RepID=UPI0037F44D3E